MAKIGSRTSGPEVENLGDADLVQAWRKGDGQALEVLIRRHQKAIYRLMLRSTGDPSSAEDLTQKAFLKALSNIERLKGDGAFRAWLIKISLNLARSRGRGILRWLKASEHELHRVQTEGRAIDDQLDDFERQRRVRSEIERLPRRQREIIRMRLHAELPFKTIAEVLGTSEASAKVTYHGAVRKLRERLGESR